MKSAGSWVINKHHFPLLNSLEADNTELIHIRAAPITFLLHLLLLSMIIQIGQISSLP